MYYTTFGAVSVTAKNKNVIITGVCPRKERGAIVNLSYFVSEDDFNETEVKIRKQNRYKTLTGTKAVKMAEQRDNSQFDRNHREWEHRSSKQKTFDRRIIS